MTVKSLNILLLYWIQRLMFQMQCELGYALSVCVYPFIALDLAKIVVSCIVGALLRKRLVQAGVLKLKEA